VKYDDYIGALRSDGRAFSGAVRAAGVDAPVPSCPEWKVADLIQHVGRLHRSVTDLVANQPDDPWRVWQHDMPTGTALLDWFDDGIEPLAAALAAAHPSTPVWSWTPDATAGFWARRQANELAIHRWDAQGAAGDAQPIHYDHAVDGIDEYLSLVDFWANKNKIAGQGETLHFHCTDGAGDGGGEWLIRLEPGGIAVTREHAKGDVAARGTASDLFLFVSGRLPAERLEVFGDSSVLARWRENVNW
jgi:uncharacterized protein (TIGR03083 family)